jgi:hypothetical protein
MSTMSITVFGPSSALAMLRALALKTAGHARSLWNSIRTSFTLTSQTLRTTANIALAAIGSTTGYDIAIAGIRTVANACWTAIRWIFSRTARLLGRAARATYSLIAMLSPTLAKLVESVVEEFIAEPFLDAALAIDQQVTAFGQTLWGLAHTSLVRQTTVNTAQVSGGLIAAHMLTKGFLAAKVVQLIPASMTAIIWLTNPIIAIGLVAGAFIIAASFAFLRLSGKSATKPDNSPNPNQARGYSDLFETDQFDRIDLDAVAAGLDVEVTPDGSVIVNGIPADLPSETAERIAGIAADAAIKRLVKVIPHRKPNRDDRRVITKIAREAVRKSV